MTTINFKFCGVSSAAGGVSGSASIGATVLISNIVYYQEARFLSY